MFGADSVVTPFPTSIGGQPPSPLSVQGPLRHLAGRGRVLYLWLCLLLSEDAVPVIPVGTGDRLLFFASAIVGRRVPLQFGAPLAWGARRLGSGLAFRSALVACHRFS